MQYVWLLQQGKHVTCPHKGKVVSVHAMYAYRESRDIAPFILNLGTSCGWEVSLTPGLFTHAERVLSVHWVGDRMDLGASLDILSASTDLSIILKITGSLSLSCGTCQWIVREDLNVRQISVKFVPWLITDKQKQQQFLAVKNVAVVHHPPYPPDSAPCDVLLLLRMKSQLLKSCFQDILEIQE